MAGDPFKEFTVKRKKGETIYVEGDLGSEMYVVQSGAVRIYRSIGGVKQELAIMEKGDFFGEISVLEGLPRTASAEAIDASEIIEINSTTFDKMIRANIEIAVRMLRKQSIRLRETNKQLEQALKGMPPGAQPPKDAPPAAPSTAGTLQAEAKAYFISISTGNVFPVFSNEALLGRFDSVTGMRPEVDLTNEDQSRNISRRHARLVIKDGGFFIAEEIGTMNGTFLNGKKLANGVLTPIKDGDELILCRLALSFKSPSSMNHK